MYERLAERGYGDRRYNDGRYILDIELKAEDFLPDEAEEGKKVFQGK